MKQLQVQSSREKEYRALSRIAAVLQAMCLLAVFSVTDALAKSSNFDRRGPVSLSVAIRGGGTVTSSPEGLSCENGRCTGEFRRGTVVRLIAQPEEGQMLSRWRGACSGKREQCRLRLRNSKRVLATFRSNLIPLKVFLRGAGTVVSSPEGLSCENGMCEGEFPRGTVVRLMAQPEEGQILSRWRGACRGNREQCRVRMRNPKRVLAVFRTPPLIPLRVYLRGFGTVTSSQGPLECNTRICRGRFPQGSLVTLQAEPGENQSFRRWRGACRGDGDCVVKMRRRPRNVLARFTSNPPPENVTLAVSINGNGTVDSLPEGVSCDDNGCKGTFKEGTKVLLTPKPGEGQKFTEWGGACEGQGLESCSVVMTTSLEVTAAFEVVPPPKVTLTVNVVGLGTVISDPKGIECEGGICPGEFDAGTTVTLLPTAGEGHEFGGWMGACTGKEECKITVMAPTDSNAVAPLDVTATFVLLPPPPVNLSVAIDGDGTVTSDPAGISCPSENGCSYEFENGKPVTLTASANPGHAFTGWSHPSCPGTGSCTLTFTADTEIQATFVRTFELTVTLAGGGEGSVTSNPAGITCPPAESCTAAFTSGTQVTMTAIPSAGNEFSGWSGDGACTGALLECTVTINAATLVIASFVPEPTSGLTDSEAMRFLEQSTWGPTPSSIAHLRNIGIDAFLNEQFNATPSLYPEPSPDSNSLSPMRDQWFVNAFQGQDQLRQRVAFALSQLFVVSANTVGNDEQMIPYQRMLHENAFGNFLDLMRMVTLSPTMGRFLDMVNNDKTDPESGLNPNENYARELLQLFTVGTTMLNLDGSIQLVNGQPVQPYDEDVILNLARVFTGWTYPPENPAESEWRNSPHYEGEMVAFDAHHDMNAKSLMSINGFQTVLPAGQTAQQDLEDALDHIFNHPNVGPFVATRLIRNLVTSNPSPEYIARVATVFNDDGNNVRGNMWEVVKAILTDPEAATVTPNGGHLREPILFAIALLRALNADVQPDHALYARTQEMGQSLFSPPSVFNYFSPLYMIPGTSLFGPEYQIHTLSTSIARVNFVDRVVRNRVGGNVTIDLSVFASVAEETQTEQLIDAVSQTLLHETLSDAEKQIIRDALAGEDNPTTRIRTVVYLIATSGRYQVQH